MGQGRVLRTGYVREHGEGGGMYNTQIIGWVAPEEYLRLDIFSDLGRNTLAWGGFWPYLEEDLLPGDLDLDLEYGDREHDLCREKDLERERILWGLWESKDLGGDTESLHGELKEEQEGDTSNNE